MKLAKCCFEIQVRWSLCVIRRACRREVNRGKEMRKSKESEYLSNLTLPLITDPACCSADLSSGDRRRAHRVPVEKRLWLLWRPLRRREKTDNLHLFYPEHPSAQQRRHFQPPLINASFPTARAKTACRYTHFPCEKANPPIGEISLEKNTIATQSLAACIPARRLLCKWPFHKTDNNLIRAALPSAFICKSLG